MTHYCMLGNQPELELKSASDGKVDLEMSAESYTSLAGQMHMHSLVLESPVEDQYPHRRVTSAGWKSKLYFLRQEK